MADRRVAFLEAPHNGNESYHEWVLLGMTCRGTQVGAAPSEGMECRDAIGRRREGAFRRWLRMRCNNTSCPATALVSEEWLISQAKLNITEKFDTQQRLPEATS